MRSSTKLFGTIGLVAVAYVGALAPASHASVIVNEAENSHLGGYTVSGGTVDPVPPAFLRGSQMSVGNDSAVGLDIAADQSPALREGEADGGGGGGGDPT